MNKKLIEVALPLDAINEGAKPETENPFLQGHPRSIHNWWARTPLNVCRAILFAQLIDDPSSTMPPAEASVEREKLFEIVRRLGTWDGMSDDALIQRARELIRAQFGGKAPEFWDMFGGRGSIPLEAQRLGLTATGSDINPVAVLINRALIEIPPRFAGRGPVHPHESGRLAMSSSSAGAVALVDDVRYYGAWVLQEARQRLGSLYPHIKIDAALAKNRPDLRQWVGKTVVPSAWIWARTVRSPNPALQGAAVPLARAFWLATKKGKECWIEPVVDKRRREYALQVRMGRPEDGFDPSRGTVNKRGATCLLSNDPIGFDVIREEGRAGRIGFRLMAIIVGVDRGRLFLSPTEEQNSAASVAQLDDVLDTPLPERALGFRVQAYGMSHHADLFSPRQLRALTTLSDLVAECRERVATDARKAWGERDARRFVDDGAGAEAYADAVATYLACAVSRMADYHCALATWNPTNENVSHLFQRQAIPMAWDFAEANPLEGKLSFEVAVDWVTGALANLPRDPVPGRALQIDARVEVPEFGSPPVVSTDPPYYDNIGYADLSDFFYVWLRRCLLPVDPKLLGSLLTPKAPELIASTFRHGDAAEKHFRDGFTSFYVRLKRVARADVPITIYYAFKQSEEDEGDDDGDEAAVASTGWETMLEGLVDAGFQVTGTLPVRTTKKARSVARGTNALASAIVIVVRTRSADAPVETMQGFRRALRSEIPEALRALMTGAIAPVDLAQSAIGPGMAVFSRYSRVLEPDGSAMRVRSALQVINQVLDEVLAEQEGEFDPDTRWALAWFDQYGHDDGLYGTAETLSKAKNVSVDGLVEAGILRAKSGKVRLLRRNELPPTWETGGDRRVSIWEATQHLIHRLVDDGSEQAAADVLRKMGPGLGETARDLAYRLYSTCERRKWAQEAIAYNMLVVAWPEITRLASAPGKEKDRTLFE